MKIHSVLEVSALISSTDEGFRNTEKPTNLDSCYSLGAGQISSWIKFKILQSKITCQVLKHGLRLSLLSKTGLSHMSQVDGSNTWNRSSDTASYTHSSERLFQDSRITLSPKMLWDCLMRPKTKQELTENCNTNNSSSPPKTSNFENK